MEKTFVLSTDESAKRLVAFLRVNRRAMAEQGKPLEVVVREHKSKRSLEQNRLYWRLLEEIAESAWISGRKYDSECWHAYFAGRFIGYNELPGGSTVPMSTTGLSVPEFSEYITKIEQHAVTDLGVELEHA